MYIYKTFCKYNINININLQNMFYILLLTRNVTSLSNKNLKNNILFYL